MPHDRGNLSGVVLSPPRAISFALPLQCSLLIWSALVALALVSGTVLCGSGQPTSPFCIGQVIRALILDYHLVIGHCISLGFYLSGFVGFELFFLVFHLLFVYVIVCCTIGEDLGVPPVPCLCPAPRLHLRSGDINEG